MSDTRIFYALVEGTALDSADEDKLGLHKVEIQTGGLSDELAITMADLFFRDHMCFQNTEMLGVRYFDEKMHQLFTDYELMGQVTQVSPAEAVAAQDLIEKREARDVTPVFVILTPQGGGEAIGHCVNLFTDVPEGAHRQVALATLESAKCDIDLDQFDITVLNERGSELSQEAMLLKTSPLPRAFYLGQFDPASHFSATAPTGPKP